MRRTVIACLLALFWVEPNAFAAVSETSDAKAKAAAACVRQIRPRSIMSTHQIPPYPELSIRLNEEGETRVLVTLGDDGVPVDTAVERSSGSARLDQAATSFVKANWRWEPFVNFCGAPAQLLVSVVWALKDRDNPLDSVDPARMISALSIIAPDDADYPADALAQKQRGMSGLLVVLSDSGQIQDVVLSTPSGSDSLDQKAIVLAKTKFRWTAPMLNGKPAGCLMIVMVIWTLPGQPKPDAATLKTFIELMVQSRGVRRAPAPP
ncbi:MAG TPA: TonB family protein [Rhizomicrobium sp.]|nr:TonB family protein [Rhizomicrobium sp.]